MPPSVEYSNLTLATVPAVVQVIFLDSLTVQTSLPLGAVTVKPPRILKLALDSSKTVASETSEILTLAVKVIASGIVQA